MSLLSCPNEILHSICALLEPENVMNFRFAGKVCADIGIEYMAHKVKVVATHWSMARVEALSLHPILNRNVQDIDISCYIVSAFQSEDQWRAYLGTEDVESLMAQALSRSAFVEYNEFCYGQKILMDMGIYVRFIQDVLPGFPNLQSIDITQNVNQELRPKHMETFAAIGWRTDRPFNDMRDRKSYAEFAPNVFDIVLSVMKELPASRRNQEVSISYCHAQWGVLQDRISAWSSTLAKLSTIHLNFQYVGNNVLDHPEYDDGEERIDALTLFNFLSSAPNLVDLRLSLGNRLSGNFFDMDYTWSKLKRLELSDSSFDGCHMLGFFRRHGATLEHLLLDFFEGSLSYEPSINRQSAWIAFLRRAKHESLTNLKMFSMRHVLWRTLLYPSGSEWTDMFPAIIPPDRSIRYLMSGQKSSEYGEDDEVAKHPYNWEGLTWEQLEKDVVVVHRRLNC